MKGEIKLKALIPALALPLAVGGLAAFLTADAMKLFAIVPKPPLSPPGWLFPIVWSILYLLMGYASYRVAVSDAPLETRRQALTLYGVQLFLNFLWPILFFGLEWRLAAFFLLLLLWLAIFLTQRLFSNIDETAADLLLPYLLWVTFAGYLNLGVYLLN